MIPYGTVITLFLNWVQMLNSHTHHTRLWLNTKRPKL